MKHPLPCHPSRVPKRKLRGKSRYYRKLARFAESFEVNPSNDDWWSFWHYHPDMSGWGNCGWKARLPHLRAMVRIFIKIGEAHAQFKTAFQTWLMINVEDAGQDAVYIHTPSPNRDVFPFKPDEVQWGASEFSEVTKLLFAETNVRVGFKQFLDETEDPPVISSWYFIYSTKVGLALE